MSAQATDLNTVEDFFRLVEDGQKADLIDGVIYMASPDTDWNDELTNFLHFLIRGYARTKKLGRVKGSRYAFILSEHRAPEPDVAFISGARLSIVGRRGGTEGPDIAVEVVSEDSRSRDYNEKKHLYEAAGVSEYWIIDPDRHRCEFYRLRDGRYELVPIGADRIFRSEALPGFWLDLDWLATDPLPNDYDCLRQILAS